MGRKPVHVLLGERDDELAANRQRALECRGYVVRRVPSGQAAAEAMADGFAADLLLLDTSLEGKNAVAAMAGSVLEHKEIPVLLLVAASDSNSPDIATSFASFGMVASDAGPAILDAAITTALRLFGAQREVRRQRELLQTIATQARIGTWEYDPVEAQIHWSSNVCEIFEHGAALGSDLESISRFYSADTAKKFVRAVDLTLREGKPFMLVSEVATASGTRKLVRTHGQVVEGPHTGQKRVLGTVQDISEIRLLDKITQESDLTLSQVEEITHIGHWSVSIRDGSFYHSDEVKRIFGYEPSEYALSVEEAINAYHPDDREEVIRLFNRAVETGEGYEFDLRVVQPDGDIRYVHSKGYTEQDATGAVTRVYGTFQDITDRELTERALRESEAAMSALVDGVPAAIVVHDKKGEILLSNPMANGLIDPLATSLVGRGIRDPTWRFVYEDGRSIPVEELPVSRVLATRAPVHNQVVGWPMDNRVTWLHVSATPVLDPKGELSRIIVSFVDITEHMEMERRLHQSEKMKAIGQLAGGVAHDFNNQLTAMMNYSELLKRHLDEDSTEYSFVNGILAAVQRSADLTGQLLAFARKGNYVVTVVDINRMIADVVSMVGHSFDKKIEIRNCANARPATIKGDMSQLQNAILNVALNSRDAMPDGGVLEFVTDVTTVDEVSANNEALEIQPGEYLRVTVRDTGVGMDAETQRHIFEPFFTTKEPGQGTGMGMASLYGTVKTHHGAIKVESALGAGTTITLYFPLVREPVEKREEPAPVPSRLGARIMVVDDEEQVASSMSAILQTEGYRVTTCGGGRAAVKEFETSWRDTDLVLLDMIMPEMSGVETFHALKGIDPDVRVVLMSGYTPSDEAKGLADQGALAFLAKPVPPTLLFQTLSEVLGGNKKNNGKSI